MEILSIYKCFCDETRLRILNILRDGPLCVCHIQEILGEPQVKISKQLSYLKRHGLLRSTRWNNWAIYELVDSDSQILEQNLKCLQDAQSEMVIFRDDLKNRSNLMAKIRSGHIACPEVLNEGPIKVVLGKAQSEERCDCE